MVKITANQGMDDEAGVCSFGLQKYCRLAARGSCGLLPNCSLARENGIPRRDTE